MNRTRMEQTLIDICDVFAGGDGAVSYFKFRCLCTDLEKRAEAGDTDAEQIIEVVYRFKKLIDLASSR